MKQHECKNPHCFKKAKEEYTYCSSSCFNQYKYGLKTVNNLPETIPNVIIIDDKLIRKEIGVTHKQSYHYGMDLPSILTTSIPYT